MLSDEENKIGSLALPTEKLSFIVLLADIGAHGIPHQRQGIVGLRARMVTAHLKYRRMPMIVRVCSDDMPRGNRNVAEQYEIELRRHRRDQIYSSVHFGCVQAEYIQRMRSLATRLSNMTRRGAVEESKHPGAYAPLEVHHVDAWRESEMDDHR